ncbi:hypothetical protein NQ318_011198 [Aromia moschata]|uniref:PiggyBac transposable element-derived protein domain-containing protein n=1 Tax=Aromia moschata TaxID=1265417 RepID=A0AAV8X4U6_9CUCU|nr:hypothetical protein NQ318_011198 [Aromia moschata]
MQNTNMLPLSKIFMGGGDLMLLTYFIRTGRKYSFFFEKCVFEFLHFNKYVIQDTNICEIKALIGLLYLARFYRSSRLNLDDLWVTDGTGIDLFWKTMSLQRLLCCLRFDNIENREERKEVDKLAAIRAVFKMFIQNSQNADIPGAYLTIDEKLESFRGRCVLGF